MGRLYFGLFAMYMRKIPSVCMAIYINKMQSFGTDTIVQLDVRGWDSPNIHRKEEKILVLIYSSSHEHWDSKSSGSIASICNGWRGAVHSGNKRK